MKPRILIADDHPVVLEGMKAFLQSLGFTGILTAGNGIEAYNMILSGLPEISIIDLDIPGMSGLEVAGSVLKKIPGARIIIFTIHKEISVLKRCRELGVKGYLIKD